jgi:hypothetical protein
LTTLRDLLGLGYEVDADTTAGVVAIRGFGVAMNHPINDPGFDAWLAKLADPAAHAERVRQSDPAYTPAADTFDPDLAPVSIGELRDTLKLLALDATRLDAALAAQAQPVTLPEPPTPPSGG